MRWIASLAMVLFLAAGGRPGHGHEAPGGWEYPFYCCFDSDCAPIEAETVREGHGGFTVTIAPGQHPMWSRERRAPLVLEIPYDKAKPSPDGRWHLCIDDAGDLLCFFAPPGDS